MQTRAIELAAVNGRVIFFGGLPKGELLIFLCHHGVRSLDAAAYFVGHGLENVRSLRGGIDAWSQEVDPNLPRYELE
jgi:monothiol glutaredoxin